MSQAATDRVQLFAAEDLESARLGLLDQYETSSELGRVVCIQFKTLPVASEQCNVVLQELAVIALQAWPDWYCGKLRFDLGQVAYEAPRRQRDLLEEAGSASGASVAWLKLAVDCCHRGQAPLMKMIAAPEQIRQLALTFDPQLTLMLCCEGSPMPGERVHALARWSEWLAENTTIRIIVLVSSDLAGSEELDPISYLVRSVGSDQGASLHGGIRNRSAVNFEADASKDEPAKAFTCPTGRPHPGSPGEQRLAAWLARDARLANLFLFNQPLVTCRGSRYLVDLLWPAGKLVVEVDGYENHTTPYQFRQDRQRDYELFLSGYSVLRLTHVEVMQDVEIAVDKIRDVVNLRTDHHDRDLHSAGGQEP